MREKCKSGQRLLFFRLEFQLAQRLFGFESLLADGQQPMLQFQVRLLLALQIFFEALEALGGLLEIVVHQLDLDILDIAHGIDAARGMRHGGIVEQPHHVGQRVRFAQRHQRRGIFLAVLLHSADVHVLDRGVSNFLGLENLRQFGHALIRHARDAHVRFARLHACIHARARQNPEQTCLPDLR